MTIINGTSGNDVLTSLDGADILYGMAGDDTLYGNGGSDVLNGGTGNDKLYGQSGNDTYVFGRGDGSDEIGYDYDLSTTKLNVLQFKLGVLPSDLVMTRMGSSSDLLIGIAGTTDTIQLDYFFRSDDVKNSYNPIQQFIFSDGTIWNLDTIRLHAMAGTAGADTIVGTVDADTIDGGAGNDLLTGGAGNDTYLFGRGDGVDEINRDYDTAAGKLNTLQFKAGVLPSHLLMTRVGSSNNLVVSIAGTSDTVQLDQFFSSSNDPKNTSNPIQQFKFADGTIWNLDEIRLHAMMGTLGNDNIGGTIYADSLVGGVGDDTLSGGAGADTIEGGSGNDLISGGAGNDTYLFGRGDGLDEIFSDYDTSLTKVNILKFKAGVSPADLVMTRVNKSNNLIVNIAGTTDSVQLDSFFSAENDPKNSSNPIQQFVFADGTVWNLDTIRLHAMTGTAGDDTIVGTIYADTINGGAGNDVLTGDGGNDTYLFGKGDGVDFINDDYNTSSTKLNTLQFKAGVLVTEIIATHSSNGSDLVLSIAGTADNITIENYFYSTGANNVYNPIQNVIFEDGSIWTLDDLINHTFVGTAAADTLTGNAGDDYLSGGAGIDSMFGGLGDDMYVVDSSGDVVTEAINAGIDSVFSTASFTLSANVEELYLVGNATVNGVGNALDNWLSGNTANNLLMGLAGNDHLYGNEGNDVLRGGAGNDELNGGSGVDLADYADMTAAIVVDLAVTTQQNTNAGGFDTLHSIENARGGSANDVLRGNAVANALLGMAGNDSLLGFAGNDRLDGGAGNDTLRGGLGNDVLNGGDGVDYADYIDMTASVNVNLNVITVQATGAGGSDTLTNIENVRGGSANDNLKGNASDNVLDGQAGNDALFGYAGNDKLMGGIGNDTLNGGLGNDTLFGGTGNDTYQFNRGDGQDTLTDVDATAGNSDTLAFQTSVANDQLWFTHAGNDLVVSVIGTTDKVTVKGWYTSNTNHVEGITAGGKRLSDSNVEALVSAMSAFSPPAAGQTTLPTSYQTALNPVIAANWV